MQSDLRFLLGFWAILACSLPISAEDPKPPFLLPDGFEVIEVAGDNLVHDAFCMTLDGAGRPVVSGPGYVRTLVDDNSDGVYDRSILWASLPKQGAQGLWSEGRDLYWVGDKGLWKSTDSNGDLVGDGNPIKMLELPTGNEHDAHAIRRGPDGSWYLIVGNLADGITKIQNDPNSPVAKPRAGTIWRISPDFKTRGAWSHGMRNAYDFDFLPDGQIVSFDSDGERDITLPSYRATRVMLLSPGSDAGWVGEGWKDPDCRITMPRVIASLGRGSPTGVAVYRHFSFPEKYRDAVFVLDWTFGRIIAVYPEKVKTSIDDPVAESVRMGAETFMASQGTMGFAPTDICVDPSGNLLISVGGRGTRGAIYRVRYNQVTPQPSLFVKALSSEENKVARLDTPETEVNVETTTVESKELSQEMKELQQVILAPCPWESWSEQRWKPIANKLGWSMIANAAIGNIKSDSGEELSLEARRGAVQAMLRSGLAMSPAVVEPLIASSDADLQAMGWRSLGWGRVASTGKGNAVQKLQELDWTPAKDGSGWANVLHNVPQQAQLEAVGLLRWPIPNPVATQFETSSDYGPYRQVSLWSTFRSASRQKSNTLDDLKARTLYGPGGSKYDSAVLDGLTRSLHGKPIAEFSVGELLEIVGVLQSALGDPRLQVAPQKNAPNPSIFDGYVPRFSEALPDKVSDGWVLWLRDVCNEPKNAAEAELQMEVIRTIALFRSSSSVAIEHLVGYLEKDSHPTLDIHALCALACCKGKRTDEQTKSIANALLSLQQEVREKGLNTDNHWQPRLTQLCEKLYSVDPSLAGTLLRSAGFGNADHLLMAQAMPANLQAEARTTIQSKLEKMPPKQWSAPLLRFACGTKVDRKLQDTLRTALAEPGMRSIVMEYLSKDPQAQDYSTYLEALGSSDRSTWKSSWDALTRLPISDAKQELTSLMAYQIRVNGSASADPSASRCYARMREAIKKTTWQPVPKADSIDPWWELLKANLSENEFAILDAVRKPSGQWLVDVNASAAINGDNARGKLLFSQAKCAQCHGSGSSLGPDLAGISKRFSREDLFRAIYEPNRDVSDRYRAMKVVTTDGNIIVGMKVYDAADGITLQGADGSLIRVNQEDIESKGLTTESLMPVGLLEAFSQQQLADLYTYLQSM